MYRQVRNMVILRNLDLEVSFYMLECSYQEFAIMNTAQFLGCQHELVLGDGF